MDLKEQWTADTLKFHLKMTAEEIVEAVDLEILANERLGPMIERVRKTLTPEELAEYTERC
ncbi:MAG: hypothetical protein LBH74_02490 [Nitrososphaerota archaeon]|nr:hypothetical protein [Nitrososphaerota archaeon]